MLTNIYRRAWVPLMREAGLVRIEKVRGHEQEKPKYTPYALRHYYASKLIAKGKDLEYIQTVMGHSTIEITLNVYGHLLKDHEDVHKAAAEELAADVLGPRCGKSVAEISNSLN
jgi:integrase